jgi:hypothetical protein
MIIITQINKFLEKSQEHGGGGVMQSFAALRSLASAFLRIQENDRK